MATLLGMASLAEAAHAMMLLIGYASLLLTGIFVAIALFTQSRVAAIIAVVLLCVLTWVFQPWVAYRPYESTDSDVRSLMRAFRVFAGWWGLGVVASVGAVVHAFWFREASTKKLAMLSGGQDDGSIAD